MITSVVGIDPGPSTGISLLDYYEDRLTGSTHIQVDSKSAAGVLTAILDSYYGESHKGKRFAQVEAFITGQSAGTKGNPAEVTRQLAFQLAEVLQLRGYHTEMRKAADVKLWASDKRLKAAGLLRPPENRHANDASRHALFCAVHDAFRPDPLR